MSTSIRLRRNMWVTARTQIEDVCTEIQHKLQLPEFEYDAENIYEWGFVRFENSSIELNISRKHNQGRALFKEPIHVLLMVFHAAQSKWDDLFVDNSFIPEVGQVISNYLRKQVFTGQVIYLGNDEYEYKPEKAFTPLRMKS